MDTLEEGYFSFSPKTKATEEETSPLAFYNRLLSNFDYVCSSLGHTSGFSYYRTIDKYKVAADIKYAMVYLLKDYGYNKEQIHTMSGLPLNYVIGILKKNRNNRESFLTDTIVSHTKNMLTNKDELRMNAENLVVRLIEDIQDTKVQLDDTMKEMRDLESKIKTLFH